MEGFDPESMQENLFDPENAKTREDKQLEEEDSIFDNLSSPAQKQNSDASFDQVRNPNTVLPEKDNDGSYESEKSNKNMDVAALFKEIESIDSQAGEPKEDKDDKQINTFNLEMSPGDNTQETAFAFAEPEQKEETKIKEPSNTNTAGSPEEKVLSEEFNPQMQTPDQFSSEVEDGRSGE
jgi:hypothetical protein